MTCDLISFGAVTRHIWTYLIRPNGNIFICIIFHKKLIKKKKNKTLLNLDNKIIIVIKFI